MPFKLKKISKNPTVDTSFLPDRERDAQIAQEREELQRKWLVEQEKIKAEPVTITYSYWDGSGHRKAVECKKGDSISTFLEKVRQQWHELRGTHVDNMMFIKEDLIIPHVSFSKAKNLVVFIAHILIFCLCGVPALHILRLYPEPNPR